MALALSQLSCKTLIINEVIQSSSKRLSVSQYCSLILYDELNFYLPFVFLMQFQSKKTVAESPLGGQETAFLPSPEVKIVATPSLDRRKAAQQHVRALNTEFARFIFFLVELLYLLFCGQVTLLVFVWFCYIIKVYSCKELLFFILKLVFFYCERMI